MSSETTRANFADGVTSAPEPALPSPTEHVAFLEARVAELEGRLARLESLAGEFLVDVEKALLKI